MAGLAARAEQVFRGIRQVKADNREADEFDARRRA